MFEDKQQSRENIRKRVNKSLDDDLNSKKVMLQKKTEEDVLARRKRNKEAAERSRKKKKWEFEKLQSENDQLNQDKCELVAMVQKLKEDIYHLTKEKESVSTSHEQLKRWIAKRSEEFGLTKYAQKDTENLDIPVASCSPTSLVSQGELWLDTYEKKLESSTCSTSTFPKPLMSCSRLLTPWLVDPLDREPEDTATAPVPAKPTLGKDGDQHVLSKYAVALEEPPYQVPTPKEKPNDITCAELLANLKSSGPGNLKSDKKCSKKTRKMDLATATAIESLMKLPQAEPASPEPPLSAVVTDHSFESPAVFTVNTDYMADIIVTTSGDTADLKGSAASNTHQSYSTLQLTMTKAGYVVHAF